MAVNWSWKHKKGIITWKSEFDNKKYIVNLYEANCLGALIYEYKDQKSKKNMYQFMGFWNDESHLKRCLGLTKNYDNTKENIYKDIILKIKLNTFYKDSIKIAQHFVKVGIKVELYYKEIK